MMPSRGMGAIIPQKMPGKKTITRKDDPNKVEVFKEGGMAKNWIAGAIKKPGARTKNLVFRRGRKSPLKNWQQPQRNRALKANAHALRKRSRASRKDRSCG